MKKFLTVLLTVLIAFTTITFNVAAASAEAPEEIVEAINNEEEKPAEDLPADPAEEIEEELPAVEEVAEEVVEEIIEDIPNEKGVSKTFILIDSLNDVENGKTYIIVNTNKNVDATFAMTSLGKDNNAGVTKVFVETVGDTTLAHFSGSESELSSIELTASKEGSYYYLKNDSYYLNNLGSKGSYKAGFSQYGTAINFDMSGHIGLGKSSPKSFACDGKEWPQVDSNGSYLYKEVDPSDIKEVIFYDGEGQSYARLTQVVGHKYNLPDKDPVMDGFEFLGWYDSKDGGNLITSKSVFDGSVKELFARFEKLQEYVLVDRDLDDYLELVIVDENNKESYALTNNTGSEIVKVDGKILYLGQTSKAIRFTYNDGYLQDANGNTLGYFDAGYIWSDYRISVDKNTNHIKKVVSNPDGYVTFTNKYGANYSDGKWQPINNLEAKLYGILDNRIKVVLDTQGGKLDKTVLKYEEGSKFGTLPVPTYDGHYFLGWYYEDGSLVKDTDDVKPLTLYAHWATKVKVPTAINGLVYNGQSQKGIDGFDDKLMDLDAFGSTTSAKDAGTYYATFKLLDPEHYVWDVDGDVYENQTVAWSIAPMTVEAVTELTHKLTKEEKEKHYSPTITFKDKAGKVDSETVTKLIEDMYKVSYCEGFVDDDKTGWTGPNILNKAGKYTIRIEIGNPNFVFGYTESKEEKLTKDAKVEPVIVAYLHLTITDKIEISPKLIVSDFTYDGTDQIKNLKFDCDGDGKEDLGIVSPYVTTIQTFLGEWEVSKAIDVDKYTTYLTIDDPDTYEWAEDVELNGKGQAIVRWSISPKEIDYKNDIKDLVNNNLIYNGDDQAPIARRDLPTGVSYADRAAFFLGYDNYASDAGTYVALLALDSDNYKWSKDTKVVEDYLGYKYAIVEWSIAKRPAKIYVGDASKTYGDMDPYFNRVVDVKPETVSKGRGFVGRDFNTIRPTIEIFAEKTSDNAGTYPISIRYNEKLAKNYDIEIVKGEYVINKAKLTAYLDLDEELVYNGKAQEPEVLFDGFTGYEAGGFKAIKYLDYIVEYNNRELLDNSIDAGKKHAYVKLSSEKLVRNYELVNANDSGWTTLEYTIVPKTIYTHWENLEYVYDGKLHSPDLIIEGTYLRDGIGYIQVDIPANELPEDHDITEDELMVKFDEAQKSNDAIIQFRNADTYYTFALIAGRTSNYIFVGEHEDDIDPWIGLITFTEFHIHPRELKVIWSDKVKFSKKSYAQAPEILGLEVVNDPNNDATIVDWDIDYFGNNIVYVDYDEEYGPQIHTGKYVAKAKLYTYDFTELLHPTSNYKLVNDTINFKIYRKSNEDTTPVKTGVER
ncbi:MAG: InlB B-repeat-containing protein [Erysipelotrichaceae bacterium]|nr:InlB B-repeat-containing protein [Erysipelotrichaceae bacterium]